MQLNPPLTEEKLTLLASDIKVLLMDVDGVMTDGHLFLVPDREGKMVETKGFDSQDGIALRWLNWFNIQTGVISGRDSPATTERARQVGMRWVFQGHIEKIPLFEQVLAEAKIEPRQIAYIGDDLTDVVIMRRVGLSFATANARPEVKRSAMAITDVPGGSGAVREVVELLVKAQGHWEGLLKEVRGFGLSNSAGGKVGLLVTTASAPGVLYQLTGVIARHNGDIRSISIIEDQPVDARVYFELDLPGSVESLVGDLAALEVVRTASPVQSLQKIYGKRIIIMGGGAQVGQVALGAISEADRHNIRGEHISIDTIPLVGEQALAAAVRAVRRLARVRALVLAGSLMGGDIETAVREVRSEGLIVISLNMAGSVPDACDLVVTDPVQAGVMAVMAVADTAKFTIERLHRRVF